jgi:hypothetical protein
VALNCWSRLDSWSETFECWGGDKEYVEGPAEDGTEIDSRTSRALVRRQLRGDQRKSDDTAPSPSTTFDRRVEPQLPRNSVAAFPITDEDDIECR